VLSFVDHLVYATPDLGAGIASVEGLLGCTVVAGGRHEGWGTHNALVSLGDATYLEIIAPDPEASIDGPVTLFGIDELDEPRLVTWATKATDLADLVTNAAGDGVDLGSVASGSRSLPDGSVLTWQLTDPFADRAGGILPFFIDWAHPAASLPSAGELVALTLRHPDARTGAVLETLGIPMSVTASETARISATIRTPHGTITLS